MENTLVVVPVTTYDHIVDHDWSVGVTRFILYKFVSKIVIFHGEHVGGDTDRGVSDFYLV